MFFHQPDKAFPATVQADGSYAASGLPAGEFKVTIDTRSLKKAVSPENMTKQIQEEAAKQGKTMPASGAGGFTKDQAQQAKGAASAPSYVAIPEKYADPKTSPLTATITAGSQSKDFTLTD